VRLGAQSFNPLIVCPAPGGEPGSGSTTSTAVRDWLLLPLSIASVVSHEVLETLADWGANRWADDGTGILWALEVGDPVESDSYAQDTHGTPVTVSDFVTPRSSTRAHPDRGTT
jgi:hypothetical protein